MVYENLSPFKDLLDKVMLSYFQAWLATTTTFILAFLRKKICKVDHFNNDNGFVNKEPCLVTLNQVSDEISWDRDSLKRNLKTEGEVKNNKLKFY